ncbi:Bro-N domain-containing protein [Klebsiella aerogenes]|uniref:Bro-N domain-containing protein n=1 Tax=Klebsiella aerogenes TaxID=548 RepID=UPI0034D2DB43
MTNQLAFHNTQFNVVTHNNQIWLSSKELAQALEYASAKSVTDIYNKNLDEFTDGMSLVVESTTNGVNESQRRLKVRIFSLRGAHLIAMFARTPVAKEFRRWVLDILDREVGESVIVPVQPVPPHPAEVHAFCDDYASRTELIYYQDFKPIFCRTLSSREIVFTPEGMMEWLEMNGMVFFTREELKKMTLEKLLLMAL